MAVFRGRLAGFVAIPDQPAYAEIRRLVNESLSEQGVEQIDSPCDFTSELLSLEAVRD
jgi:hypothetical protein